MTLNNQSIMHLLSNLVHCCNLHIILYKNTIVSHVEDSKLLERVEQNDRKTLASRFITIT